LQQLVPQPNEVIFEEWRLSSHRVMGQVRSGLNSLVILGAWVIWKHCVFGSLQPSIARARLRRRHVVDHGWSEWFAPPLVGGRGGVF
jgi:hypothetical protein